MAQTIESFVQKLQSEGVEAGRQAAQRELDAAGLQAQQIISQANASAQAIVVQAKQQAADELARAKAEMTLAVRDQLLTLREAMVAAMRQVIQHGVAAKLQDPQFLGTLLHDVVVQYAQADISGNEEMIINVPPKMHEQLLAWALKEMTSRAEAAGLSLDVEASLKRSGFEYTIDGATVEVTTDSVVEVLSNLVSPRLRQIIQDAAKVQEPGR